MQVSEKQLPFAHPWIFRRDRFLNFYDHLALGPDVGGGINDRRPGATVKRVFKSGSFACLRLDQHPMAGVGQSAHARRRQPDALFVVFDFFRKSDDHDSAPGEVLIKAGSYYQRASAFHDNGFPGEGDG